jgi:hypothetical protein
MSRYKIRWGNVLGSLALLMLLFQVVPIGAHPGNPAVVAEPLWDSLATRELARQACFDCHSNETQWPFYAGLAPASWLVTYDVRAGRAVLNFSEWQRRQEEAGEAAEALAAGEMPPRIYTMMHAHARLSAADRAALARGLSASIQAPDEDDVEEEDHGRRR